jgi:hypothetical protein
MILVVPVALLLCAIAIMRARGSSGGHCPYWFGAWTLVGASLTLSFLTGFSIGLLLLPFALGLLVLVTRLSPHLPEASGFVSGIGLTLIVVAYLNRDNEPCPASGTLELAPGQHSVSCGGLDPHPWLYSGIALTATGLLLYAASRRHA